VKVVEKAGKRQGSHVDSHTMTVAARKGIQSVRLEDAGLPHLFSPHSFRVAVVTDLLNQNVPLEDVQYLAGHSNPRTTQIYDRRRRVTRNIVERISI
jgi:integrase/recombinase XerD